MSLRQRFTDGISMLSEHWLNLVAILDKTVAQIDVLADPSARLILIANGGPKFWRVLAEHGLKGADPVDTYSRQLALQFAESYLQHPVTVLYLGATDLPL